MTTQRRNFRSSAPRRQRQWIIFDDEEVLNSNIKTIVHDFTADYDAALERGQTGATVMAIRGQLSVMASATVPTAPDRLAAGIAWVPEGSVSNSVGLPSPLADNYDWIWHTMMPVKQGLATGDQLWGAGTMPVIIHNKSMRKQPSAFSKLVLVVIQVSGQTANTIANGRVLWALP